MNSAVTEKHSNTLVERKFNDPKWTLDGEPRAVVNLNQLETLWFNTGTLCNLSCTNCYIKSNPTNDRLSYLTVAEVARTLDELQAEWQAREVGFTGGEPFMNPEILNMVDDALARGYRALILTNAMRPMMKLSDELLSLRWRYGDQLCLRVSVDHYAPKVHELERGEHAWRRMMEGLLWLAEN
ncbi:MAG: radical SAM protein, partial [Alphaproteobacteria bacterium]